MGATISEAPALDAFDHHDLVALGDPRLDLGQFDEHHVAQLGRGVFGDADRDDVAIGVQPLVIFGCISWGGLLLVECLAGYQRL